MPNLILRGVFSSWALLLCALPALAQPAPGPVYTVEIVVFRASSVGATEDWSAPPAARGFGDGDKPGPVPQLLRALTTADFRLAGMEATLRSSGAWRPLAHAAWVQTAGVWGDTHAGLSLSDVGINVPGLMGTIYVERGQYLHLGFNLSYANGGPTYSINEMRSIKLGDKLYFDHPAFGVLATVSAARR
jgi:hypothetical protein